MTKHDLNRLFSAIKIPEDGISLKQAKDELEIRLIQKAIASNNDKWNLALAARKLRLVRASLYEKLKRYGLYVPLKER